MLHPPEHGPIPTELSRTVLSVSGGEISGNPNSLKLLCSQKKKNSDNVGKEKAKNCRSHGLQEPFQELGLCLRNKVKDMRKVKGEGRKVDFHLHFGTNQIHSSLQNMFPTRRVLSISDVRAAGSGYR